MKKTLAGILMVLTVLWQVPAVRADDSDIFTTGSAVEPNVMILIDTSGSMHDSINGVRKLDTAKDVVSDLINDVDGVRFGVMCFNEDSDGAHMVGTCGSSVSTMTSNIDDLVADGWTPLGRASGDIDDYFKGTFTEEVTIYSGGYSGSYSGGSSRGGRSGTGADRRDQDRGGGSSNGNDGGGRHSTTTIVSYPSPIQSQCQKNYAILVTDGMPTGESETLVQTEATALHTTDHSTTYTGSQPVTVHTVGFNVPEGTALLTQTATNGGGSFYAANNASELAAALRSTLEGIIQEEFSFAAPLVPSTSATGGTKAYLASFETSDRPFWKGYLKAYNRDSSGTVPTGTDGKPLDSSLAWDAGTQLAAKSASTRTIYTIVSGSLTAFTKANMTTTLLGTSSSTTRDKIVDFIRGVDSYDEDGDGNTTEQRAWKLGDIFHSNPVLVFPPPLDLSDSTYQTFKTSNASRTAIVVVGANDGMLHAFRQSDGEELWAFIPPNVLGTLKNLTPSTGTHPYYVDATPVITDIKISGTWKTIVVFGERRGGDAYYALDITNTTSPAYLWSFTDAELDESWSDPAFGQIKMSDNSKKDVAFIGGGYDTAANNSAGRAFYVVDLSNGSKLWQYKQGSSNDNRYINFSIPASPTALDLNADGLIDRVYVGDIGGQIWKFDVSAAATTSSGLVTNWTGKRLFVSDTSQSNPPSSSGEFHATQAMYGAPELAMDSNGALWVYIGTGDRNHPNDTSSNRFYGIKDNTNMTNGTQLTESSLVNATSTSSITQGWYLPLASNEKTLASATVFNNTVFFTTYAAASTTQCDHPRGTAALYGVRMSTGRAGVDWSGHTYVDNASNTATRSKSVGGGLPSEPALAPSSSGDAVVVGTSDQQLSTDVFARLARRQLRYWREVLN